MGQGECKPCSTADPTADTVKVDQTLLSQMNAKSLSADVEKVGGAGAAAAQLEAEAAEKKRMQEREALELKQRLQEEEQRRRQEEEEEEARALAEAEAKRLREEAELTERAAAERAAVEAERAAAEEARRQAEEAASSAAERERKQAEAKVATFLRERGFKGIREQRKKCFKACYPLHAAVEENSADVTGALLKCGADKALKNSSGKTPLEVAQKLNKKGSHDAVIALLSH